MQFATQKKKLQRESQSKEFSAGYPAEETESSFLRMVDFTAIN